MVRGHSRKLLTRPLEIDPVHVAEDLRPVADDVDRLGGVDGEQVRSGMGGTGAADTDMPGVNTMVSRPGEALASFIACSKVPAPPHIADEVTVNV